MANIGDTVDESELASEPAPEPTYEQKIAAVQKKITDTQNAKPQAPHLPGWLAAPVGAVSSALPGLPGVAGGIGALAAGHPFSEGYKLGTQAQNNSLGEHPIMGTLGAIGGAVLSPTSKAIGALKLPFRALAGGVAGAAQGAGMATNLDELKHNAGIGGALGLAGTIASHGISQGLESVGGYLGNARNRLIDYFGEKGAEKIAQNPELSVLGQNSNAIGAPGPKSVPSLGTSEWLRTPEEKELAQTAAKAVPILSRSRPQSAIVQTMGPEHVNDVIGNKVTDYAAGQPLYKALNHIGKLGGADVNGNQLQQNIQRAMAAKQLGPQSPLSSLFESATGQDLGESARHVANTADENLFYSPRGQDPGAMQMEQGAKDYLGRLGDNMANRHGGGYVAKPQLPASGNPNANLTTPVNMNAPITGPQMQPHSTFMGAGQPSSKIQYSQYSPSEAADIGGAAERTNAINIGRNGGMKITDMMKKFGSNPITGAIPGLGGAARVIGAMRPANAEIGAGLISKLGNGVSAVGRGASNSRIPLGGTAAINANKFSSYEDPSRVTSDFLSSHMPKDEEEMAQ